MRKTVKICLATFLSFGLFIGVAHADNVAPDNNGGVYANGLLGTYEVAEPSGPELDKIRVCPVDGGPCSTPVRPPDWFWFAPGDDIPEYQSPWKKRDDDWKKSVPAPCRPNCIVG